MSVIVELFLALNFLNKQKGRSICNGPKSHDYIVYKKLFCYTNNKIIKSAKIKEYMLNLIFKKMTLVFYQYKISIEKSFITD